jgi:hypothetical protein
MVGEFLEGVVPADSSPPSYEDLLAENAVLRALVADLTGRLEQALARIAELEARLNMSSKNSSKPPSSDGLAKPAPKSLRKKTGRGPGRPGSRGPPCTRSLTRTSSCGMSLRSAPAAATPSMPRPRWR